MTIPNAIPLSDTSLETDANGLPASFCVMKYGKVSFTKAGVQTVINFTRKHAESIVNFHAQRASDFPIDVEHASWLIANELGLEEYEIPYVNLKKASVGWWKPEVRGDGLYAVITRWEEIGKSLLERKLWHYFSPVIRGLQSGNLRVSSLALTNNPALDQLDAIVASADLPNLLTKTQKQGSKMDKITAAVMAILGTDAVALSGDDVTNADEVATKLQAFALDKNKLDEFVAATRGALALSADTDLTTIQGTIIANKEQAGKLAEVTEERDALALSVETAKHSDLLTTAKAEGKIVGEQMEAWAKGLNSVALSAFLDTAPVIVEPKKIVKDEENDAVALSGDTEFYAQHGLTLEQVNQHGGQ